MSGLRVLALRRIYGAAQRHAVRASTAHYCNIIEAPWLVHCGHGASLRHRNTSHRAAWHAHTAPDGVCACVAQRRPSLTVEPPVAEHHIMSYMRRSPQRFCTPPSPCPTCGACGCTSGALGGPCLGRCGRRSPAKASRQNTHRASISPGMRRTIINFVMRTGVT
jgi:hypothetical protein